MNNHNFNRWLENSKKISEKLELKPNIAVIFHALLEWIHQTGYAGACHDTSAVMHILLAEAGIKSSLCIGIAKSPNDEFFDHSWIEIEEKIYDASISLQNQVSFAPIFASIDLENNKTSNIIYGINTTLSYDEITKKIILLSLEGYSDFLQQKNRQYTPWTLTAIIGEKAGMKINADTIKTKHSNKVRQIVNNR